MSDRITKAEGIASKWAARVVILRTEIVNRREAMASAKARALARPAVGRVHGGWFWAWERQAIPLARAIAALERAERLAPAAAAKVHTARRIVAKASRHAADIEALGRRLDKVAEAAPRVMRRWENERKDEPKRIAKRKKAIARRTSKDLRGSGDVKDRFGIGRRRRRTATEPPIAETFPTGPIIPYEPPAAAVVDRVGLLPGDYRLIEGPMDDAAVDRSAPKAWTADYVGRRLVDAHAVLRRLPMITRPKEFGSNWPEYIHQGVELAYQAGAGTLHQNRGRQIKGTSADEVARMNEALAWPMEYLKHSRAHAWAVNEWAFEAGLDDDVTLDALAAEALDHIAAKLNAGKVRVT